MLGSFSSISLVCVLLSITQTYAFFQPSVMARVNRKSDVKMMFGIGKKKDTEIIIKVDGKAIKVYEKGFNLRKELIANGVDVYPLKAKITGSCGGNGACGTCAVKVLAGKENMNPQSKNEQNTLKGKPADFRLSCCSKVNGPISIKLKP
mmetsp:Transcript_10981/g.10611  ORF Transcript_10981/g.10611 Transcript_10981/m.10611 type:complete len:149 (+) Transcript_10981:55-501(+)